MGLLDGDIRRLFGTAFGGVYLDGQLLEGTQQPIYDGPRITGYTDPGNQECKVQVTRCNDAMRAEKGYAEGDVGVILLADGLGRVTSDMHVTCTRFGVDEHYRLMSANLDSAGSHWTCRGRLISGG